MNDYLLSVYAPSTNDSGSAPSEVEIARIYAQVEEFNSELRDCGAWVYAGGLMPADEARVVRVENGELGVEEGPYPTGGIPLGGFWVVSAEDIDAAIDLGAKASAACQAMVEVREFQGLPDAD